MRVEAWAGEGLEVRANVRGFLVTTDQPTESGGTDGAPTPLELFVASLATCGTYYAQRFCRRRGLATDGLRIAADVEKDAAGARIERIELELSLPDGFPEQYREALIRSVELCAVKRALEDPPIVRLRMHADELAAA